MATLYVVKEAPGETRTVHPDTPNRGAPIFTTLSDCGCCETSVTAIYRGRENANNILVEFKDDRVIMNRVERKRKDMVRNSSTCRSLRVFDTAAGPLKWKKTVKMLQETWHLVRDVPPTRRFEEPLLKIAGPERRTRQFYSISHGRGPSLDKVLTFSPEALSSECPHRLLVNGRPTATLELAIVVLEVIDKIESEVPFY